jgi:phospholipase C
MARTFPIADRYFCSVLGQTYPNRRYLIAATPIGQIDDTGPALTDYPANGTIFDALDAAGVTWRDYYTPTADTPYPTIALYPPLYLKNVSTNVQLISQFFADAAAGTLPGFSLVEPNYDQQSDEDPQNIAVGEQFAASVINAAMSGPGWPFARPHYVSHRVMDHASICALAEYKWSLPAMTYRDANAWSPLDMLDLHRTAFATPPALAPPLPDTDPSALACNVSGPGTIPPPGSVTPG